MEMEESKNSQDSADLIKKSKKEDGELQEATFHGGFVRNRGENRGVRIAKAKRNEVPGPADPEGVAGRQEELDRNKRPHSFPSGSSPLKVRKTKLACLGIPSAVLDAGNREYARCVRLANHYKKQRQKEFYLAHGFVSSGVAALLAAASLALSGSRYLYEVAARTAIQPAEKGNISQPQMLKIASSLADSARQNELAAWELCVREAVVKRRNDLNSQASPWLTSAEPEKSKGPGRPRKLLVVASETEVIPDA